MQLARVSAFTISLATRAWLCAAAVVFISAAFILWDTAAQPNWSNDGYQYSIRMQMDRGVPFERARDFSRAFYADKPPMSDPRFLSSVRAAYPEYWSLFSIRTLYPWLASRLPESLGMRALLLVSNAAYVLFAAAVFLLCLEYAAPEAAAVLALCVTFLPIVRALGRADLTDMLASALWAVTLLVMVRFVVTSQTRWLVLYAVFATLMTLARPIPYIPLCGSAALLLWALISRDRRRAVAAYEMGAIALALCVAVAVMGAQAHAPSFVWILGHIREGSRLAVNAPLWQWYVVRVGAVTVGTIVGLFAAAAAPIGFAALLLLRRGQPDAALCAGVIASTLLTIAVNPILSDVDRVIVLPLLPVAAAGLAVLIRQYARVPRIH